MFVRWNDWSFFLQTIWLTTFKRNSDPQPFRERDFLDFRFLYDNDSKLVYIPNANFLLSELLRNLNSILINVMPKGNAAGLILCIRWSFSCQFVKTRQLPKILGVVGQKFCVRFHRAISLIGLKLWATTPNNMQQGVQMDATCNIEQC